MGCSRCHVGVGRCLAVLLAFFVASAVARGPVVTSRQLSGEATTAHGDSHGSSTAAAHGDAAGHSDAHGDAHGSDHSASGDHSAAGHDAHAEGHGTHPHQYNVLFYLFNGIILGTIVVHVTSYVPFLSGVQPTVAIFVLGMFYAVILEVSSHPETEGDYEGGVIGESYKMWMDIDPHLLLFTMLPLLLTGDAMTIDTSVARLVAKQCIYLAGPGVLICTFVTASFIYAYLPYDWDFMLCVVLGSIMAATDPVAVVSLLKELGASPILTVQIQGESLLNDGAAIVLFTVAYDMLRGVVFEFKDIALFLVKTAICAWLLGSLVGGLFALWIRGASNRHEHSSAMIQISLTICCAYVSFFLAEGVFHISGVLSTVAASLVLADNMWSAIVNKEAMHQVWHLFEYFGNTTIFFLAGSLTAKSMVVIPYKDYMYLFYIYVVLTIVRGVMLFTSRPILQFLSPSREPVSKADCCVMCWGGLRGAVGLALAMLVSIERAEGVDGNGPKLTEQDAQRVLFYTGGVACFTMLLNATTCPHLVMWLGITQTSTTKKHILLNIHQQLQRVADRMCENAAVKSVIGDKLREIEHDICPEGIQAWQDAEEQAKRSNALRDTFGGMIARTRDLLAADTGGGTCLSGAEIVVMLKDSKQVYLQVKDHVNLLGEIPEMPLLDEEDEKCDFIANNSPDPHLLRALQEALLVLVRSQYWNQIDTSFFAPGSQTPDLMLNSISHAMHNVADGLTDLVYIEDVLKLKQLQERPQRGVSYKKRGCIARLLYKISDAFWSTTDIQKYSSSVRISISQTRKEAIRETLGNYIQGAPFQICIMVTISINTVLILVEDTGSMKYNVGWLYSDILFTLLFTIEFAMKFWVLGKKYFWDGWNVLDFACLVLAFFALVIRALIVAGATEAANVPSEAEVLRLNRIFRVMRVLRAAIVFHIARLLWAQWHNKSLQINAQFGNSMDIIQAMRSLAIAHIRAHEEFLRYFGDDGTLVSVEEVHCILESRNSVYLALARAAQEASALDPAVLEGLIVVNESSEIVHLMSAFVFDAQEAGVISCGEAELIDGPLKMHNRETDLIRADSHCGLEHPALMGYKSLAENSKKPGFAEQLPGLTTHPSCRSIYTTVSDDTGGMSPSSPRKLDKTISGGLAHTPRGAFGIKRRPSFGGALRAASKDNRLTPEIPHVAVSPRPQPPACVPIPIPQKDVTICGSPSRAMRELLTALAHEDLQLQEEELDSLAHDAALVLGLLEEPPESQSTLG